MAAAEGLITNKSGLRFGALGAHWAHVCVDMQRMFAEQTPWRTPWMPRVLPEVVRLVEIAPERTIFTRFVPPRSADEAGGAWRRYYRRWDGMTRDRMPAQMIDLVPELAAFAPPAHAIDKMTYSPWHDTGLRGLLAAGGVDTLVISGAETEVCVLATVLGAIDLGFRVVLATDAICSSADPTHDAMLGIYRSRYGMQVETATAAEIADGAR